MRRAPLVVVVVAATLYAVATAVTTAAFIGDAPDYAQSIHAQFLAGDCFFLEFGHLLWRPSGYGLTVVTGGWAALQASTVPWLPVLARLDALVWMAGLVAVVALAAWLHRVTGSATAALSGVAVVIFAKVFLNHAQTGNSYIPALACFALALWVAGVGATPARRGAASVLAGVALAGSMLYWATFVLAAPAALLLPLLLTDDRRATWRWIMLSAVTCGVVMLGVYAWAAAALGLHTVAELRTWVAESGHGIAYGGVGRAAIGLARFLVDVGDYGTQVKRHLLPDPYNPVTRGDLFNFKLARFIGAYLFAFLCVALAWRAPGGRRAIVFFSVSLVPVVMFGVAWQGGDMERYLSALPAIALVVARATQAPSVPRALRLAVVAGLVAIAVVNGSALSNPTVERARDASFRRLDDMPDAVPGRDLFVVSHWQDPLMAAVRNDPFDARVRAGLTLYPLLTPGAAGVERWREQLEARVSDAWARGAGVWVSRRLLAERPASDWGWNEGEDPRASWRDLHRYFAGFTYDGDSAPVGREFLLLPATPENRTRLATAEASAEAAPARAAGQRAPSCRRVKVFGAPSRA